MRWHLGSVRTFKCSLCSTTLTPTSKERVSSWSLITAMPRTLIVSLTIPCAKNFSKWWLYNRKSFLNTSAHLSTKSHNSWLTRPQNRWIRAWFAMRVWPSYSLSTNTAFRFLTQKPTIWARLVQLTWVNAMWDIHFTFGIPSCAPTSTLKTTLVSRQVSSTYLLYKTQRYSRSHLRLSRWIVF